MTATELREYQGQIAVVTFLGRNGEEHNQIASIRSVSESGLTYYIGHPYDIEAKEVMSGAANRMTKDLISIRSATRQESWDWYSAYVVFHKEILEEHGYDFCKEKTIISVEPDK